MSLFLLLGIAAVPERSEAAGIKDVVDGAICTYVESDAGAAAGRKVITRLRGSSGGSNGVLLSVAIWSAQQFCPLWVPRITGALSAAFSLQGAPTSAPTKSDVAVLLRRIQAAGVTADLRRVGITESRASVQRYAGDMCRRLRQGTDAASLGRRLAGQYQVRALAALSGLVGLTKNCTYPPAAWQLDSLSGALATTLVGNTYARDVEPPIVALHKVYRTSAADGRIVVTLDWFAYDSASFVAEPWFWFRGSWRRLNLNLNRPDAVSILVPRGESFQFAVRATDVNSNTSAFAYSAMLRA